MLKYRVKTTLILTIISLCAVLPPRAAAQTGSSATKIDATAPGVEFSVDGTVYAGPVTLVWPTGSKHVLQVTRLTQPGTAIDTQYGFVNWQWLGATAGTYQGNPITITSDPSITEYKANFTIQYVLTINFYSCGTPDCVNGPGVIYVGGVESGTPLTSSTRLYCSAGANVLLYAKPNPGYVFAGWNTNIGAVVQGFQVSLTMNQPQAISPVFQVARTIHLLSSPPGFQVLADHAALATPVALEWGVASTHTVGPVSPQIDQFGQPWVFSSWSDSGAANHAFTVPTDPVINDTLIATYVPGAPVCVDSSPRGLSLSVDGRSNWPSTCFTWGVGEVHQLSAPAQQTDSQNRVWGFAGWSNGGAAAQSITIPATAVPNGMTLIATYTPVGHLTVTTSLSGVSLKVNGQACGLPCDIKQPVGTQVTVSAPASVTVGDGSRQDLAGWSNGAPAGDLVLTLGADPISVSANYRLMNYLDSSSLPAAAVSWSFEPASPDGYYDAQATVNVAVKPLAGYRFRCWTGDLNGPSLAGTLAMSQPHAIRALLDKVPYVAPGGVVNGAGVTPQTGVAPGSVITIFGLNLASDTVVGTASPMKQTLGGLTVVVGDRILPLFFVSSSQINAQLPPDLDLGDAAVTVSTEGQPDVTAAFKVVADAPGLFAQYIDRKPYVLAFHADGTLVTPSSPATHGEVVTVYGTGFGPTDSPRPFGLAVPDSPVIALTDPIAAQFGDIAVTVQQAFAAPGLVGVDAIQIVIPDQVAGGSNPALTLTANGQASNALRLPVK